jgi:hypothetical protein
MSRTLFENTKLLRDSILTWSFPFLYPLVILGIVTAFGGGGHWAMVLGMTSLLLLYTLPLTMRYMWTNIVSITEDFGQLEVTIKKLNGQKTYGGLKREFRFVLNRDLWSRGRNWYINVYFRGKLIGKQFHLGLRRHTWIDDIASQLSVAGLDVEYI